MKDYFHSSMFLLFTANILLSGVPVQAGPGNSQSDTVYIVVSGNGDADFASVQEAFNSLNDLVGQEVIIRLKNGIYREKLVLPCLETTVSLIGENRDSTLISYDDFSGKVVDGDTLTTHNSCSFRILSDNFSARNITFGNSAGPVGQAVAVEVNSDKVSFYNCGFLGYQDTYYTNSLGRIYMKDCYIEGSTDFIFGKSIVLFENCTIHSKKNSYITAASTPQGFRYGYVFKNCTFTADPEITTVFLGRPWRDYARVVFIDCYLGGHIRPEGWHNWNKPWREETAYFAEYKCRGPGSDREGRVDWSFGLSDEEADRYDLESIFSKISADPPFDNDWLP
jgi:pectinesterase